MATTLHHIATSREIARMGGNKKAVGTPRADPTERHCNLSWQRNLEGYPKVCLQSIAKIGQASTRRKTPQ